MRLKTSSGAALAVAALLATAACVSDSGADNATDTALSGSGAGEECKIDETVKIGAVFSLTETAAFAGAYQQEGLELAVEELNAAGGIKYELILEDDGSTVDGSTIAFEKLINRDKVSAIIGPTLSNMAFSTYTDAESAGVAGVPTLLLDDGRTHWGTGGVERLLAGQPLVPRA